MNKNTYLLGIFFLAISFVAGVFQSIVLVQQGLSLAYSQSYAHWYLAFSVTYLIANGFILLYFYSMQWRFVFVVASISLILFVIQFILQYVILITVARELNPILSIVAIASITATLIFAVGLMVSKSRENKILVTLAIMMIVTGLMLISALVGQSFGLSQTYIINTIIWTNVAATVFPLLFILVFLIELKSSAYTPRPSGAVEGFYYLAGTAGMMALVGLLTIGGQLGRESYWNSQWQKNGPEEARKVAERFEARMYVNDQHDTLHYLFMRPLDYDSTQKYPLLTCLHGGPTRIAGNVEVAEPARLLSDSVNRKKYPAFLFVPQGRPGVLWGGIPGIPSLENLVFEAMDALENEFKIDETRRYVAGGSGGGYGSWHFICTYPEKFAAAMPMCGAGNPKLAEKIVNVPVWAFHGAIDRNVPVTGSRNMIEAIRKAGGNPKYNEFPNVGHNVWPEVAKTTGVLDWLFAQRKGMSQ